MRNSVADRSDAVVCQDALFIGIINNREETLCHLLWCLAVFSVDPLIQQPKQALGVKTIAIAVTDVRPGLRLHDLIVGVIEDGLQIGGI